jgi:hypothetical protein
MRRLKTRGWAVLPESDGGVHAGPRRLFKGDLSTAGADEALDDGQAVDGHRAARRGDPQGVGQQVVQYLSRASGTAFMWPTGVLRTPTRALLRACSRRALAQEATVWRILNGLFSSTERIAVRMVPGLRTREGPP